MNPVFGDRSTASHQRRARRGAVVALGIWLFAFPVTIRSETSPEQLAFFESKVRPLLFDHCYECHGDRSQKGGLRLDSKAGWERGGVTGPVVIPSNPGQSLILKKARQHQADLQLLPTANLSENEIETLVEWVKMGAPDPRDAPDQPAPKKPGRVSLEEGRKHWAFQPITRPRFPAVRDVQWPRNSVDHFVLALLEDNDLAPVADAEPHVWLRRVTFDLTGLPPTEAEIASFISDASPRAKAQVVERLLSSVAFGERWARHWLDLVGYADQFGTSNEVPAPYAWRYRDYVIHAFNADKPFDRFIREQIAGDLLFTDTIDARQDALIATGFLLLGEIHIITADKVQLRADIVDHQIQKIGTTFLGQTLGCVRCHDHKFDPISLQDYYGLAGIFGSSEAECLSDRSVWSSILTTQLLETDSQRTKREAALRDHREIVAKVQAERADLTNQLAEVKQQLTNAITRVDSVQPTAAGAATDSARVSTEILAELIGPPVDWKELQAQLEKKIANLDTRLLHLAYIEPKAAFAYSLRDSAKPGDARIAIRGNPHAPGGIVPRGFVRVASLADWPEMPRGSSGRLQLADWLACADNPLPARVTVNRIWQKLFGEGLVRSVDYFGTRGERPTHPELLDWLASEFVRGGWSQKKLIREIVLSRTYSLGTMQNLVAAARDPDNRLLWRMNRRRLDAEALRDAILATSDQLLSCTGGPGLALQFPENVGTLDSKDPNPVNFFTKKFPEEQQHYRTIYLPVLRSRAQPGPAEIRNLFDFVPPTEMIGQRPSTSVAPQALFLMNSEFMKSHAAQLAAWLLKQSAANDHERLERLYLRVLNRPVTDAEIKEAERFLESNPEDGGNVRAADIRPRPAGAERATAWAEYCHALLSSNEFLYCL